MGKDVSLPLLLIGHGPEFRSCADEWRDAQPGREIAVTEIDPDAVYGDGYLPTKTHPAGQWSAFGMLSPSGLNVARAKLMLDLKLAGYHLDSFASPHAFVPASWRLPEHSFVSAGAHIENDVRIAFNLFVDRGALIRRGATVGRSVFIGASAQLGFGVKVGDGTLIGPSIILAPGVVVGRQCEVLIPNLYASSIEDRTFISPQFEEPVRVLSA